MSLNKLSGGNEMNANQSLLEHAANGNAEELENILQNGKFNIHEKDENGNTPLILAAMNDHPAAVRLLLQAGSFTHTTNKFGHNALIVASMMCSTEVVEIILEHSRKVSERTSPSIVALMCANSLESQGCMDVAHLLRNNPG